MLLINLLNFCVKNMFTLLTKDDGKKDLESLMVTTLSPCLDAKTWTLAWLTLVVTIR